MRSFGRLQGLTDVRLSITGINLVVVITIASNQQREHKCQSKAEEDCCPTRANHNSVVLLVVAMVYDSSFPLAVATVRKILIRQQEGQQWRVCANYLCSLVLYTEYS